VGGTVEAPETRSATVPITVHQLLTHTAGLTYGFQYAHPVDALYRAADVGDFTVPDYDLDGMLARLGELPLLYEPGTRWGYSVATDVCGALIERITGERLDDHLRRRVLGPLGMDDTGFSAPAADVDRCSVLYATLPGLAPRTAIAPAKAMTKPPKLLGGGGGLVGTTDDYLRFCHMLLNGGELDGARLLSPRTLSLMTRNHLSEGRDLNSMGQATFSETEMAGMGFGLGFSTLLDAAANRSMASEGTFAWGGAASTAFWVDPVAEVCVVFMTQLLPSSTHPLRKQLQVGVYQALVG
jgi:CubicO group peptidase (beta-lactamase class C family)